MRSSSSGKVLKLVGVFSVGIAFFGITAALAQISAEEHASHHPGTSASPGASPGPGMMSEMGEKMKDMGAPPPKQLYPTLMSLPSLSPEQRQKVEQQADERMRSGTALMTKALDQLAQAQAASNFAAMHDATVKLHEGMAQFDSGTAAKRALAEGKPPPAVALDWFKREMNLAGPVPAEHRARLSWLHIVIMTLLIAFAATMIWLYFARVRRANDLLSSLTGTSQPAAAAPITPPAIAIGAAPPQPAAAK